MIKTLDLNAYKKIIAFSEILDIVLSKVDEYYVITLIHNDRMAPSLSKYSAFIFLVSFIFGSFSPVNAVQINNLYSASVPIASQQKRDRLLGFDQAFSIVLVKASGQFDKVTDPEFLKALLPAEPLVQTFSYRENSAYQEFIQNQSAQDDDKAPGNVELAPDNVELMKIEKSELEVPPLPYLLDVSFAPSIVEEKMADHGLDIWGRVRPSVLVWVAHEQKGERSIVGTSDAGELVENLVLLGEQRGVPLYLPVADLQDVSAIDVDEVWGLFPESVDQASERYRADSVVMMRVSQSGNGLWSGNWLLNLKQTLEVGAKYDSTLPSLLEALVSDLAAKLSSHYAVSKIPGEDGGVLNLEVDQVSTFADYIEIQRYLNNLPPVSSMNIAWVRSGRAGYQVTLIGSKDQFFEHVDLGGRLKKDLRVRSSRSAEEEANDEEPILEREGGEVSDEEGQGDVYQDKQAALFEEPTIEEDIFTSNTEYYIWSSDNALFSDKSQNIDQK